MWSVSAAQFIFRGEETATGAQTSVLRPYGYDVQQTNIKSDHVVWAELQVWVALPARGKFDITVCSLAPSMDGSRRAVRVIKISEDNFGVRTFMDNQK